MTESDLSDSDPAPNRFFTWLGLAAVLVLLDQASKQWIIQTMAFGDGFEITSFFNIVRVHNHGAAFSFLAGE
ncbi:MAG: signal peptidase II, partial [Burkholderiaceae bacterium]|nr:signal peptidase II [Burkholderiaceae bacterium]